jgi:hypothetical protein
MAVMRNVVNPMCPLELVSSKGKQRAEDGVKSERRPVMERIALQDLGYPERKLTYTYGLRLQEG